MGQVRNFVVAAGTVLVVLDSDHSRDHVLKELEIYAPMVTRGSYVIVEDSNINGNPIDPASGVLVTGDITAQTEQVMRTICALLEAAGAGVEHLVRTTVFLADMNEFAAMNECYAKFLVDPPPARATVQVARLPRDVRVEIDAIAVLP